MGELGIYLSTMKSHSTFGFQILKSHKIIEITPTVTNYKTKKDYTEPVIFCLGVFSLAL